MIITRRRLSADFVVVGGGIAGLCAAVAAARNGAKTVIIQDRPMFGGMGLAKPRTRITFVSQAAMGRNVREKLGLRSCVEPVCNIRGLNKHDMVRNGNLPKIEVDPETFAVKVDGVHATVKPAQKVALGQLYFFS